MQTATPTAATPSSGPPVFLLSLPQPRPGTQRYNWELGRLGSLALVGRQSRRRKTLITNPPLSCGRFGRDKGYGSKPRQKIRSGAPKAVICQLLASFDSSCSQAGAKHRALHSFGSHKRGNPGPPYISPRHAPWRVSLHSRLTATAQHGRQ